MTAQSRVLLFAALFAGLTRAAMLPERLDTWSRERVSAVPMARHNRALWDEYGLKESERALYATGGTRRVRVEAFRFASAEGGHGAFLWLRPVKGVGSPLASSTTRGGVFGQSYAAVGGGVTVLQWKNYLFRFHRAVPPASAVESMLNGLRELDPADIESDACCRYFDNASERLFLGPIGLTRFAPRIPVSLAFRPDTKGRVTRWETLAGPMTRVVLDYPRESVASERLPALRSIAGAAVRQAGRRVGVVLDATDIDEASELLSDMDYRGGQGERGTVGFDFSSSSGCLLTMDEAIAGVLGWSIIGAIVAFFRYAMRSRDGIPDRTISLRLSP